MSFGQGKTLLQNSSNLTFFIPPPPAVIISFHSFFTKHRAIDPSRLQQLMDTERGSNEVSINCSSDNQNDAPESWQDSGGKTESCVGKALAQRAIYGSSHGRRRGRRARSSDAIAKRLPSRLSKVSIANEPEN